MKGNPQFRNYRNSTKWQAISARWFPVLLIVVLMFAFLSGATANVDAYQKNPSQEDEYFLFVEFYQPVTADKLAVSIGETNINVKDWTFRWNEYTGINFPKENMSLRKAGIEFENEYKTALASILEQLEAEDDPLFLKGHEKEKEEERYEQTRAALERESEQIRLALADIDTKGMRLTKFTLQGKKYILLDFVERNKASIKSYNLIPVSEHNDDSPSSQDIGQRDIDSSTNPLKAASVMNLYSDPWKFAPEQGWVRNNTQTGFIDSIFIWWDKSGFDSIHQGYEHDVQIWAVKDEYVKPGNTYISNMPDSYADTTFLDDWAMFTNGSEHAENVQPWQVYWSSVKLDVVDPGYPYSQEHWENVGGEIAPQISSWAGAYNDHSFPPEWEEILFCDAHSGSPTWCLFADQTYVIGNIDESPLPMYYDSNSAYADFPFQHDWDRKYHWYKGYNAGWLQCPQGTFKGYYINPATNNVLFTRCDGNEISFNWGDDGPNHQLSDDNFMVQWSGDFYFPTSGVYKFTATPDDGIRVWLDGWDWNNNLIIDGWDGPGTFTAYKYVYSGTHRINVKYREDFWLASVNLDWHPLSQQAQQ